MTGETLLLLGIFFTCREDYVFLSILLVDGNTFQGSCYSLAMFIVDMRCHNDLNFAREPITEITHPSDLSQYVLCTETRVKIFIKR